MHNKLRKEKKKYAASESLYNLDGEHSGKTIHERYGSRHDGSPGAMIIDLSKRIYHTDKYVHYFR